MQGRSGHTHLAAMGDLEIVVTGLAAAATVGGATVVARKDSQNSGSGINSDSESLVRTRLRGWALRLSSCIKTMLRVGTNTPEINDRAHRF